MEDVCGLMFFIGIAVILIYCGKRLEINHVRS